MLGTEIEERPVLLTTGPSLQPAYLGLKQIPFNIAQADLEACASASQVQGLQACTTTMPDLKIWHCIIVARCEC